MRFKNSIPRKFNNLKISQNVSVIFQQNFRKKHNSLFNNRWNFPVFFSTCQIFYGQSNFSVSAKVKSVPSIFFASKIEGFQIAQLNINWVMHKFGCSNRRGIQRSDQSEPKRTIFHVKSNLKIGHWDTIFTFNVLDQNELFPNRFKTFDSP